MQWRMFTDDLITEGPLVRKILQFNDLIRVTPTTLELKTCLSLPLSQNLQTTVTFLSFSATGLNMSESQNSPPPQLGTNSSSVAIAILVPFFALIFTGFGFYLYKQRFVSDLLFSTLASCLQLRSLRLFIFTSEALFVLEEAV